jgi:hypothetical protein
MWLSREDDNAIPYNFVFYEPNKIEEVVKLFAVTQYESATHSDYNKLENEDQQWLENANMPDYESDYSNDDVEMELDQGFQESSTDISNKATSQAYLHDRTFVIKDNNSIGVYKTNEEDILTVNNILNLASNKSTCCC